MKIVKIDVFQKEYNLVEEVYAWSRGNYVTALDSTIMKITTDAGLTGFGECTPLGSAYIAAYAGGVRAGIRELGPKLLGQDPLQVKKLNTFMDTNLYGHDYVKSPIDMACWDLLGKATGLPLCVLLGGRYAEKVPIYRAVSQGSPQEMVERTRFYRSRGYWQYQLKVGGDVDEDIQRIRAVLRERKPGERVIADANTGWSLHGATRIVNALKGEDVYIEQPCMTLEECVTLRRRTDLPMVLDESITDMGAFLWASQQQAMDIINIKLSRVGGLTKAMQIRDLAQSLGVAVDIEDSQAGDISATAICHMAASTPPEALFIASMVNNRYKEHIAPDAPRAVDGFASVPTGPGLGITVDEDSLGKPVFTIEG